MIDYVEQIQVIRDILSQSPSIGAKRVHVGDFSPITNFPAISVELKSRRKEVRGIGGLADTICIYNIWIYCNKPSYEQALEELQRLVAAVEKELSLDRYLKGTVDSSNLSADTEFGVADRGGVFLQTALMQFSTRKLGVS